MQSLSAFFEDNKPLAFAIMFAALLVLIIVLFLLYRVLFGRRLRTASGGRARQPRLGIVDAYDLDRQRQLVLVRRDNVEHLIMIGGPNDVVLESSIVRTLSAVGVPAARDKDVAHPTMPAGAPVPQVPSAPPYSPSLPPPGGPALSPPPPPRQALPYPAVGTGAAPPIASAFPPSAAAVQSAQPSSANQAGDRPPGRPAFSEEGPPAQATGAGPVRPAAVSGPGRPGGSSAPTRPGAPVPGAAVPTPRPAPSGSPPRPASPPRAPAPLPPRPSLTSNLPPRPPRPVTPTPPRSDPAAPPQRGGNEASGATGTAGEPETRPVRPPDNAPPVSVNIGPSPSAPAPPKNLETLESLEEEMAKLLGRPAAQRDGQSG